MSKIIIFGSSGLLGHYLHIVLRESHECISINRSDINAADITSININRELIASADCVVNCIGVTKPNIKTVGYADTISINTIFPNILSRICNEIKTPMIHISSDCVFSGKEGKYIEGDNHDATDIYAKTKSLAPPLATTILTSFIGEKTEPGHPGLLNWILRQDDNIHGYTNCLWNGITCLQLSEIINNIIITDSYWIGTRHVFSPRVISKYDLCTIVNDVYELDLDVIPHEAVHIEGTTIPGVLDRSLSTIYTPFHIPSIERQLNDQRKFTLR